MGVSRNTTFAIVSRCVDISPHPDPAATRVEVLTLSNGVKLVTGLHYRVGDLGVYIRPGCLIPEWLAEDLWLPSKGWFEVRLMPIGVTPDGPKVESAGLWAGSFWRKSPKHEFEQWFHWRDRWQPGHTLDGFFGIVEAERSPYTIQHMPQAKKTRLTRSKRRRHGHGVVAQSTEQLVANQQVAGSNPAHASNA